VSTGVKDVDREHVYGALGVSHECNRQQTDRQTFRISDSKCGQKSVKISQNYSQI